MFHYFQLIFTINNNIENIVFFNTTFVSFLSQTTKLASWEQE